jgi:RNase P/RNase MRP subunit p29
LGGRGRWISEFEATLVYRVSSRTARAIQRNPVLKNQEVFQGGSGKGESLKIQGQLWLLLETLSQRKKKKKESQSVTCLYSQHFGGSDRRNFGNSQPVGRS